MATYVLTLEGFHINECRANTDTDTAVFSLAIGGGNSQFLEQNIGDVHKNDTKGLWMSFPAFDAEDRTNVRFGYVIVNDGATRGDANNEKQLMDGIRQQLANGMLQVTFGTSRSGLVSPDGVDADDETDPAGGYPPGSDADPSVDVHIDWSKVWDALKPLIEAAANAFFKWFVALVNPNCDGFVAGDVISVSGESLRASTYRSNPWRVTKNYPGYDSPNGCGSNSYYTVTYSVTRQDVVLDPANINGSADVIIVNKNSGLALDVPGSANGSNVRIQQYNIHGQPNQQMRLTLLPGHAGNRVFTISPRNSQLNFDVTGGRLAAHTLIQQFDVHPDYADQQWIFDPAGDGSYFIRSATTQDLVLDVPNASKDAGSLIQLYPRKQSGAENEQWWLRPL